MEHQQLTVAKVSEIPKCYWCSQPARYDFKTWMGPWAYGCGAHYQSYSKYPDLGTGKGQRLELVREGE